MSPRDFLKMCEGFNLRHRREYGMKLEEMKLMRWVGSLIYNVNVKKNNRKDPEKLYSLPELPKMETEKENKKLKVPTNAEMDEIANWSLPRKLDDKTIMDFIK